MRGELLEAERVYAIVGGFYAVYNDYGYGLSESIYARALELELELVDRGHQVVRELAVGVRYKGRHVGCQRLDMVVDNNRVVVEAKARDKLPPTAGPQLISCLHASPFHVGVLLHFGPKPTFQRFVDFPRQPFALDAVASARSRARRPDLERKDTDDANATTPGRPGTRGHEWRECDECREWKEPSGQFVSFVPVRPIRVPSRLIRGSGNPPGPDPTLTGCLRCLGTHCDRDVIVQAGGRRRVDGLERRRG